MKSVWAAWLILVAAGCAQAPEPAVAPDAASHVDAHSTTEARQVDTASPAQAPSPSAPTAAQPAAIAPPEPAPSAVAPALPAPSLEQGVVRRAALTRAVVEREPVDPATEFRAGSERLYAFFELANSSDSALDVEVRFVRPDGSASRAITLHVPPSTRRYRTWAYTRGARRPGEWAAVARTTDGRELARLPFRVVE